MRRLAHVLVLVGLCGCGDDDESARTVDDAGSDAGLWSGGESFLSGGEACTGFAYYACCAWACELDLARAFDPRAPQMCPQDIPGLGLDPEVVWWAECFHYRTGLLKVYSREGDLDGAVSVPGAVCDGVQTPESCEVAIDCVREAGGVAALAELGYPEPGATCPLTDADADGG